MTINNDFEAPTNNKKQRPKWIIAVIALGIVSILGAAAVLARDDIMMAVAPKPYAKGLLALAFNDLNKQLKQVDKALSPTLPTANQAATVSLGAGLDSFSPGAAGSNQLLHNIEGFKFDSLWSYNPDPNEYNIAFNLFHKGDKLISLNGFVNDQELGLTVPEILDSFWVVPSKEIGTAWNDSALRRLLSLDTMPTDLDLSATRLNQINSFEYSEQTLEAISAANKELQSAVAIDQVSRTKVTVNAKQRNGSRVVFLIPREAITKYLNDVITAISSDPLLADQLSMTKDISSLHDSMFEELHATVTQLFSATDNYSLTVDIYKGRFAAASTDLLIGPSADDAANISLNLDLNPAVKTLNDYKLDGNFAYEGDEFGFTFASKGEHVPKNGLITDETDFQLRQGNGENVLSLKTTSSVNISETSNNLSGTIIASSPGENSLSVDYQGTYNNTNGVTLDLANLSISIQTADDTTDIKGNFKYSITHGADSSSFSASEKVSLLDMSGSELTSYFLNPDLTKKVTEISEKISDIMYGD